MNKKESLFLQELQYIRQLAREVAKKIRIWQIFYPRAPVIQILSE